MPHIDDEIEIDQLQLNAGETWVFQRLANFQDKFFRESMTGST